MSLGLLLKICRWPSFPILTTESPQVAPEPSTQVKTAEERFTLQVASLRLTDRRPARSPTPALWVFTILQLTAYPQVTSQAVMFDPWARRGSPRRASKRNDAGTSQTLQLEAITTLPNWCRQTPATPPRSREALQNPSAGRSLRLGGKDTPTRPFARLWKPT